MAKRVSRVRHATAAADTFIGKTGELTVDTTKSTVRVHNGTTPGGTEQARADLSNSQPATVSTDGKMSQTQVSELTTATADIATNASGLATEITDRIADVDAEETRALAAEGANATAIALRVSLAGAETITGAKTFSGISTFTGRIAGAIAFILDGVTAGAFKTSLAVTDPTADRTQTFADQTGTFLLGATELPVATQLGGDYIKLTDTKTANTQGGNFTAGAWRTRTLNVEDFDTGSHSSISSNRFTLDEGTYRCLIHCPAQKVARHKAKLVRNPGGTPSDELIGTSEMITTTVPIMTTSIIQGQFDVTAGGETFEIQHRCSTSQPADGFGVASNLGVSEVYTVVELWKVK